MSGGGVQISGFKVVSLPDLREGSVRAGGAWSHPAFAGEESGGGSCIQGTPRGGPLTVNTQPFSDRVSLV